LSPLNFILMNEIIVNNGPDINPSWDNIIAINHDFAGTVPIVPHANLAANGQLLNGQDYFYKVVARMEQRIVEVAVTGGQTSAWVIKDPVGGRIFWRLWDDAGVRKVQLYRSPDLILAYGYRTGNGSITLNSVNDVGTSGSVTVAYTTADNGYLDITKDVLVGYEEATATPTGNNRTINITWTLQTGVLIEYRIYRGTTTKVYDRVFTTTGSSFHDDGLQIPIYDVPVPKKHLTVTPGFTPATYVGTIDRPAKSWLCFEMRDKRQWDIDLTKVTNQPTWNLNTQVATQQAMNDVQTWL
jgi:hypothetical protein